ncbi:MAG TPA: type II toxin-antitoxin system PemK/MazF family toxin [Methanosarcinaceae archaeon]|nr:type II toxin-antitoxin system PemK/MazF family toxin [Methanosarcinaceae archaeon]
MKYGMKKMTPSSFSVDQREIVWLKFTFSDSSDSKIRPGLIVSNNSYNKTNLDVLCCAITSSKNRKNYCITIDNTDIESGKKFTKQNKIRYDTILKVDKNLIESKHGMLKKEKSHEIINAIQELISIE